MSNEIAIRHEQNYPDPLAYNVDPTGGRLVAWAEGLAAAHRIGSALCQTAFAPAHFKGKPEEAAAAIMFGDEVGLSPTQALRSIFVISGTPSLYARQMAALVLHHGHEVWTVEKSDVKVTVSGKRRGSTHEISETWTTARAQKAGYTNNKKYATDPQAMLYARALADVCRQIAPDALAGLAYTVEEMEILEPAPTQRVSRAKAATAPMPEPDLEPTPQTGDAAAPTLPSEGVTPPLAAASSDVLTPKQLKAIHAGMGEAGLGERVAGLQFLSEVTGREVTTSKDLTPREAGRVLDELAEINQLGAEPPVDAS
jgi:hypothetical protein